MPEEIENWRTAAEACGYLSISDNTLQPWITHRGLPVHRVGRTMRFKFTEIDAWVRSANPSSASPADRPQA